MSRPAQPPRAVLTQPRIIRTVALFVGVAAIGYLAAMFWFDWQTTLGSIAALGVWTLIAGAACASTAYLWRFARWEYSLHCMEYSVPRGRHLSIYLSGLALTATPGKAGETFRSALLLQYGVRIPHSLAAFFTDRASDVLGVCLLGGLAAWGAGKSLALLWIAAFAVLLVVTRGIAYALTHPRTGIWWAWLMRQLKWLPVKGGRTMLEAWARLWTIPRVLAFSAVALIAYGTQALVFAWFCVTAGVGLSIAECVLIFVQATLFGAASMIPGGLGAMEAALVFQLVQHGVSETISLALAIAIRLVTLWLGIMIGALSLLLSSEPIKQSVEYDTGQ